MSDNDRSSGEASHWRLPVGADLRWNVWGDEAVVFHPDSGDTHVLHLLAAETLYVLGERGSATAPELAEHLASALEVECDESVLQHVEQCLARFHELGLIERLDAGEGSLSS